MFPGKYHQNGGFSMAMLDYRSVNLSTFLKLQSRSILPARPLEGSCRMELLKFDHPQGQAIFVERFVSGRLGRWGKQRFVWL